MPALTRRRAPQAKTFANGPWTSTEITDDPFDSGADKLVDASNVYAPDIEQGSGFYARPGMNLLFGGSPLVTQATAFRGQGIISHTDLSGTTYNFVVFAGKLWRSDAQFVTATDVTPAGITIDPTVTTRVYGTSFANTLVITDGVNRPWLATNLSATPITGTNIQFNAANDPWSVYGPFRLYAGSGFAILNSVNSVSARTDLVWSAPGDLSTGYQQTNYDYRWTMGQTEADALTAIYGTNTGLVYWREHSIGIISGIPGPNLQSTHTDDAVSRNIGTLAPQSIVGYGTVLYFTDAIGRPYRWVPGFDPEPIWLQMRGVLSSASVGFSGVTKSVTTAAYEATMNAYIVAVWSTIPSQDGPPVEGYIFDARTGKFFSRFSIASGTQIDCLGSLTDANGRSVMIALGSLTAPTSSTLAVSGYAWGIKSLEALGDYSTTEASTPVFSVTEDGVFCTTEGTDTANWMDGAVVPTISITTPRFGYEIDTVLNVDRGTVLMGGGAVTSVSALTAAVAQTVEGTPTPSTTQDDVQKLTCGFNGIQGRGVTLVISPTTATTQFSIQRVAVDAIISKGAPDEV
jgi:hypothetical protein